MRNEGIALTKGRNPAYKMLWPGLIVLMRGDGRRESKKRAARLSLHCRTRLWHPFLWASILLINDKPAEAGLSLSKNKMPPLLTFSFCICARRRSPADQDPEARVSLVQEVPVEES